MQQLLDCVAAFPRAGSHYACQSIVPFALPYYLGIQTTQSWWRLHIVLTVIVLLGTGALLWRRVRRHDEFRIAAFWLAVSSFPVTLLQFLGLYDVYTLAGGTLVALASGAFVAFAGGMLMGGAHAEQALVASCALLCAAYGLDKLRDLRIAASTAGVVSGVAMVKLRALLSNVSTHSRADLFWSHFGRSLGNALQVGTAGLYAWYGLAWLLVLLLLWRAPSGHTRRVGLACGLLLLPASATLLTLDGTRVFVCTAWPAFAFGLVSCCDEGSHKIPGLRALTALALCLTPLLPAYTTMASHLYAPNLRGVMQGLTR